MQQPIIRDPTFSYFSLEERVPAAHPLRELRAAVDALLATMNREFEAVYARRGRPSVPPEMLLKVTPHVAAKDKHSAVDGRIRRVPACDDRDIGIVDDLIDHGFETVSIRCVS